MTTAMRDAWADTLVELCASDPRTVVLDGDLASSTKAQKVADAHPGQFFQMGIAEQNMVGVAAGLAHAGQIPWVSSFGVFLSHRAADAVRMLVAQTNANVKIAAGYTGVLFGMAGKTHHDHSDLAILRALPGITLLAPGDGAEAAAATRWANAHHGPVYLRLARDVSPALPGTWAFGELRVLRDGDAGVLVSTGAQSARTLAAAELLAADGGPRLRVVHAPTLKPFDGPGLVELCADAPVVITVEDHVIAGGLGGLVAETLSESEHPRRVRRIGLDDTWVESGSNDYLLERYGLSADAVAARVRELLA